MSSTEISYVEELYRIRQQGKIRHKPVTVQFKNRHLPCLPLSKILQLCPDCLVLLCRFLFNRLSQSAVGFYIILLMNKSKPNAGPAFQRDPSPLDHIHTLLLTLHGVELLQEAHQPQHRDHSPAGPRHCVRITVSVCHWSYFTVKPQQKILFATIRDKVSISIQNSISNVTNVNKKLY